jgi:4-hydroxybenzoyl-CoA thioesterase
MRTHSRTLQIEWGDCDPAGIVFYPRYFTFFDASTHHLFAHVLGMRKAEMLAAYGILGTPMVDTRARFIMPCAFGDDVTIETELAAFRRSSFDVHHRLLKGGTLAVEAWETRVWAGRHPEDPKRLKAVPIPAEVIVKFG